MLRRWAVRYVLELWRTDDDRVEGVLTREGASQPTPFSGWTELFSLLEPPPLDAADERHPTWEERMLCPRPV